MDNLCITVCKIYNLSCTCISPVAHTAALSLDAAADAATNGAIPASAAVAVLVSPLDVVQLRALKFKHFALFDCLVVLWAEPAASRWPPPHVRAVSNR